jgi:hypothetical protein
MALNETSLIDDDVGDGSEQATVVAGPDDDLVESPGG